MKFSLFRDSVIILITLLGLIFAVPNVLSDEQLGSWPNFLPGDKMELGLDLQGGVHVLLKIDRDDLLKSYRNQTQKVMRRAVNDAVIRRQNLVQEGAAVRLQIRNESDVDKARVVLAPLIDSQDQGLFGGSGIQLEYFKVLPDRWFEIGLTEEGLKERIYRAAVRSSEIVRNRIDALGTTEPNVVIEGEDGISVQLPGFFDQARLEAILGSTARLEFRMVDPSMSAFQAQEIGAPPGSSLLSEHRSDGKESDVFYVVRNQVEIQGEEVADATGGTHPERGTPVVNFRLTPSGASKFSVITKQNTGRQFAIVLDDKVVSAPSINQHIPSGVGYIEGPDFTTQSVNDFSAILRSGALPAKLVVGRASKIGASLGADSVSAGQLAALVGVLVVLIFMFVSYGALGVVANLAVVVNLGLIIGILSLLGATLTLPGIAGLVLTVGMAVDSNVLIIERAREEFRDGKKAIAALEAGFDRALITILDANITTLIAAGVLFQLGSGPVRGFAVTLAIGILTTVFTAFSLTRLFTIIWVAALKPKKLPI